MCVSALYHILSAVICRELKGRVLNLGFSQKLVEVVNRSKQADPKPPEDVGLQSDAPSADHGNCEGGDLCNYTRSFGNHGSTCACQQVSAEIFP